MTYSVINPPFTMKFDEMSKGELKEYFRWFQSSQNQRIQELTEAVRDTPGFESWQPDLTPQSLELLGQWLSTNVATRARTREERDQLSSGSRYPIEVPAVELTNQTFSIAMDMGMYLAKVMVSNHPGITWEQPFGSKRFIDYGQPVLVPFAPGPFNP